MIRYSIGMMTILSPGRYKVVTKVNNDICNAVNITEQGVIGCDGDMNGLWRQIIETHLGGAKHGHDNDYGGTGAWDSDAHILLYLHYYT